MLSYNNILLNVFNLFPTNVTILSPMKPTDFSVFPEGTKRGNRNGLRSNIPRLKPQVI